MLLCTTTNWSSVICCCVLFKLCTSINRSFPRLDEKFHKPIIRSDPKCSATHQMFESHSRWDRLLLRPVHWTICDRWRFPLCSALTNTSICPLPSWPGILLVYLACHRYKSYFKCLCAVSMNDKWCCPPWPQVQRALIELVLLQYG